MKTKNSSFILLAVTALALTACSSNVKKELGFESSSPDEFTVVHRAPLAMPPDYTLRPPQPGMVRPQDEIPSQEAQSALFGDSLNHGRPLSAADASFLSKTGATQAAPNIRPLVDRESAAAAPAKKPAIKRLLGMGAQEEPAANVVDPAAEAARLRKNQQTGQPVTAGGDTPSKEE